MNKKGKGVAKIEKRINKGWVKMLIEERRTFEEYYSNLYSVLKERYDVELEKSHDNSSKVDLLQEFMDEITTANHDMNYNYSISEIAEMKESALKSLHRTFESELNSLMSFDNNIKLAEGSVVKKKDKSGRPNAIVKSAVDYIQAENSFPKNRLKFISELRKVYEGDKAKTFNILIQVLINKNLIKPSASNKEIKQSFENAIIPIYQSQPNFNRYLGLDLTEDPKYDGIFTKVSKIAEDNYIF